MKNDDYGWPWYHDDGRHCPFATYLLEVLTQQDYIRWDSYIEQGGKLVVRQDGIWAVKLDDKGHQLLNRLRERARSAEAPSVGE